MRSNAKSEQTGSVCTSPWRLCEFVKVDEKGDYIGAYRNSTAWDGACQRPAERIFRFENHNAYLCRRHYDRLIRWLEEDR